MLRIEFDICTYFVIHRVISAAGLCVTKGVMTAGVSDWLWVNPAFG